MKSREYINEMRLKRIDLHKSSNGYKNCYTPKSTVRAMIKKFRTTGAVANLPGRGHTFIAPSCTVRRMVKEAKKKTPRISS